MPDVWREQLTIYGYTDVQYRLKVVPVSDIQVQIADTVYIFSIRHREGGNVIFICGLLSDPKTTLLQCRLLYKSSG